MGLRCLKAPYRCTGEAAAGRLFPIFASMARLRGGLAALLYLMVASAMDTPPTTPATARSVSRVVSPASGGGLVFTTPPNSTPTTAAPQLSAQPKNPYGWQVHDPHGKGDQPTYLSAKDTAPRDPDAPAAVPWQARKATRDRGNSIGNAKSSKLNPAKPKGRPPKAPKGVSHPTSKAAPGQQQEWFLECLQGGRAYPLAA
jgi:hypothetical protein